MSIEASVNSQAKHTSTPLLEIHPTFRGDAAHPGDVLVQVMGYCFYVHRDVLYFSSPFFQSVLQGGWKESTGHERQGSTDVEDSEGASLPETLQPAVDSILLRSASRPPSRTPSYDSINDVRTSDTRAPSELSHGDAESIASDSDSSESEASRRARRIRLVRAEQRSSFHTAHLITQELPDQFQSQETLTSAGTDHPLEKPSEESRQKTKSTSNDFQLERLATPVSSPKRPAGSLTARARSLDFAAVTDDLDSQSSALARRKGSCGPAQEQRAAGCTIVTLRELDPFMFHDFLHHIYPHLNVTVTWRNCGGLLAFSDKFDVPSLRRVCEAFLRASLAGRPILALMLAETYRFAEVYKEASRHVLDNYSDWKKEELDVLSKDTLLQLERQRSWFLERVLKLGLTSPRRDFECQSSCPAPAECAQRLHERWKRAYAGCFQFGPPQPSALWRLLRDMDGAGPALGMSLCETAGRSWARSLFDRMFQIAPTASQRLFLSIRLQGQGQTARRA